MPVTVGPLNDIHLETPLCLQTYHFQAKNTAVVDQLGVELACDLQRRERRVGAGSEHAAENASHDKEGREEDTA
jgi:hypothetical protein